MCELFDALVAPILCYIALKFVGFDLYLLYFSFQVFSLLCVSKVLHWGMRLQVLLLHSFTHSLFFRIPVILRLVPVSGVFVLDAVERFNLKFCKNVIGVKRCTQNNFVYGEVGRKPLCIYSLWEIPRSKTAHS